MGMHAWLCAIFSHTVVDVNVCAPSIGKALSKAQYKSMGGLFEKLHPHLLNYLQGSTLSFLRGGAWEQGHTTTEFSVA